MKLASGVVSVTVGTGGSGYSSAPSVSLTGGGGTGASAVAQMNGTMVDAILITNPGKDYTSVPTVSLTGGGGTGAAGTAAVLSYDGINVISMFRGRFGDLYGVDGKGRGFRWDGDTDYLEPIGISKPAATPVVTIQTGASSGVVRAVAIVNGGAGYFAPPAVTFKGGGLTDGHTGHAEARAKIGGARVVGMTVDSRGGQYSSAPSIEFSGGLGTGAAFAPIVSGSLQSFAVTARGSGYTTTPFCTVAASNDVITCDYHGLTDGDKFSFLELTGGTGLTTSTTYYAISASTNTLQAATTTGGSAVDVTGDATGGRIVIPGPRITFGATGGLTGWLAGVNVDANGALSNIVIYAQGTGATTTPTASIVGGGGTGAALAPVISYAVQSVTVTSGGTGYLAPPAIGFRPTDGGARAIATVSSGSVTSVEVLSRGSYSEPPTVVAEPTNATAIAVMTPPIQGEYYCCIRYVDDTSTDRNGPTPSSISELAEVTAYSNGAALLWKWSNNGAEARAHKVELWRTTADQRVVLYRVAVLDKVDGVLPNSYTDVLSDDDLLDAARETFGLMPIVMPSGQLNARRFVPPKNTWSQACMFQDRAWFAGDPASPNSIWHSEVDEPESAPEAYELILQEQSVDADEIVTLKPLNAQLLVFQNRHLYKIQYVSQPLIDASVSLAAYRGVLNPRCVDVYDGVAFAVDHNGMYAYDGGGIETISVPVDDYWRDGRIDFSKKKSFFVAVNPNDRVVRFYYCTSTDGAYPTRCLCFCLSTKVWWEETYPVAQTTATNITLSGRVVSAVGADGRFLRQSSGDADVTTASTTGIPYEFRTGPFRLTGEQTREVGVLYKPTATTESLQVRAHFNGSTQPRPNAIYSDPGSGFIHAGTAAALDMRIDRSALGSAPGYAVARHSGRADERSAGGDKHAAIAVGGVKQTGTNDVAIYAMTIGGVSE